LGKRPKQPQNYKTRKRSDQEPNHSVMLLKGARYNVTRKGEARMAQNGNPPCAIQKSVTLRKSN